MTLLLTHGYFLNEDPIEQQIMRPYPPLGLLYVSAWLDRCEIPHHVIDPTFLTQEAWMAEVRRLRPSSVAFYVTLMTRQKVLRLIAELRAEPGFEALKVVLGGPDTRHNAEAYLTHGADVLVMGEGEETMAALAPILPTAAPESLAAIPGVAFLDQGAVRHTPERLKLPSLADLPRPARHKIDLTAYLDAWKGAHGASSLNVNTMRGCPYSCRWCSRAVYGKSYRRRPVEDVVAELAELTETYGPDQFWFVDDVFTVNHRWLEQFAEALDAAGLKIRYECISRAERMNDRILELLVRTGCDRVWIGAESGSQKILDAMERGVDVGTVTRMMQETRAAGIRTGTFLMLGYPGETERDILATLDYLKHAQPDDCTITLAYPIKGTPLYDEVAEGLQVPAFDQGSDRDYRFPRAYPEPYYAHAIRFIGHRVALAKGQVSPKRRLRHWLGAAHARMGMARARLLGRSDAHA